VSATTSGTAEPGGRLSGAVGVLAVTYAVASASWFWLERPALASRWANRTTTPRGKPRTTVPEAPSAVSAAD